MVSCCVLFGPIVSALVNRYTLTTSILNVNSIWAIAKFNNTSRSNWKPLSEVNFSKNSTKIIRLFALDFYEVIVDSAFGLINYHLIKIESE